MADNSYKNCRLCPRNCGIDRTENVGCCGSGSTLKAARAGLHFYEEPYLSGTSGSGTVFFSGCSLGCVYCQNYEISSNEILCEKKLQTRYDAAAKSGAVLNSTERNKSGGGFHAAGTEISIERLADIFLEQQARGANNINLVTGTHYTPSIAEAIKIARSKGLTIPTLWNSSGYEKVETLQCLEGLIDIWLPDFKTLSLELGKKYMNAPDYPEVAKEALEYMVQENGKSGGAVFKNDLMVKGVNVRHLVLPGSTEDSKKVVEYLHDKYGDRIWVSIMSQYTPVRELPYKELNRKLTKREYNKVVDFAIDLGMENVMIQEGDVAETSFIPKFDGEGIIL